MLSRRTFLYGSAAIASVALPQLLPTTSQADEQGSDTGRRLRKTLKMNMVKDGKTLEQKFSIVKQAGFEGIELDAPGFNVEEAKQAAANTGIIIDGTVNATHWNIRHSDPDPEVRAKALQSCIDGLRATAAVGADTLLLVVGHGKDGTQQEVYQRSLENIRKAVPVAEEVGVKIAIENVWNHFLYDHEGGTDQTADALAKYVDEFQSPWVGVQFDIGNHWKYGDPAQWIRTLGSRIIKLDVKGFSRAKNGWTQMAESDIRWSEVRKALVEINFRGWVAAEMAAGDLAYLKQVSREMDELLVA